MSLTVTDLKKFRSGNLSISVLIVQLEGNWHTDRRAVISGSGVYQWKAEAGQTKLNWHLSFLVLLLAGSCWAPSLPWFVSVGRKWARIRTKEAKSTVSWLEGEREEREMLPVSCKRLINTGQTLNKSNIWILWTLVTQISPNMFIYDLKAINLHLLLDFTLICSFLFQAALPFTNIKNTKT